MVSLKSPWLPYYRPEPRAWLRLFCFPFAGGGAAVFQAWKGKLLEGVEVCAVQYPGRESRLTEPSLERLEDLVSGAAAGLRPFLDLPCVFFGHSMGALVAFELIRELRRSGQRLDLWQLIVSARRAPHLPGNAQDEPPVRGMDNEQLMEKLRRLNGTPESILRNREIREIVLPIIRTDFQLLEDYQYREDIRLACPISAFGGIQDTSVSQRELAEWKAHTQAGFVVRMFPGDHFYLQSQQALLWQTVAREIASHRPPPGPSKPS
jgi:surfactin synthase thioesterase subunit